VQGVIARVAVAMLASALPRRGGDAGEARSFRSPSPVPALAALKARLAAGDAEGARV